MTNSCINCLFCSIWNAAIQYIGGFIIVYRLKHELKLLPMTSVVYIVDTKRCYQNLPDLLWVAIFMQLLSDIVSKHSWENVCTYFLWRIIISMKGNNLNSKNSLCTYKSFVIISSVQTQDSNIILSIKY